MRLPIVQYGAPVLRRACMPADLAANEIKTLISDMWETMYQANGCGLAAPQINQRIRLFVVDSIPTYLQMDDADRSLFFDGDRGTRETFINPTIIQKSGRQWQDEEGCLSIPGITLRISRPWSITIRYVDEAFEERIRTFSGLTARMIQHEYDHIEGKLLVDYLDAGRKLLLKNRLDKIRKGV